MDYNRLYLELDYLVEYIRSEESKGQAFFIGRCMPLMPGIFECLNLLRRRHYPSGSEENELFMVHVTGWVDALWVVAMIPIEHIDRMKEVARESDLNLIDGPLIAKYEGKDKFFPVQGVNVYGLQIPEDHPTNLSDPNIYRAYKDSLFDTLKKIRDDSDSNEPVH